jgi:hypothetical protein
MRSRNRLFLCAGMQSSGSTSVSWFFLQRADMNGVLDADNDILPSISPDLGQPHVWYKTTISSFRLRGRRIASNLATEERTKSIRNHSKKDRCELVFRQTSANSTRPEKDKEAEWQGSADISVLRCFGIPTRCLSHQSRIHDQFFDSVRRPGRRRGT